VSEQFTELNFQPSRAQLPGSLLQNDHRLDLTVSEKMELGQIIEQARNMRQGQRTDLELPPSLGEVKHVKESADIAAKAVDMKPTTYRKAKAVVLSELCIQGSYLVIVDGKQCWPWGL